MNESDSITPRLAVQFVNYHTKSYLLTAVSDVRDELDGGDLSYTIEIYNNSPEQSLESMNSDTVHVHQGDRNIGFGSAHNYLAGLHQAELLLIANPDIRLIEKRTIARLIATYDSIKVPAAIGALLVDEHGQSQAWDHGELSQDNDDPLSIRSEYRERTEFGEVAWVSGADLLLAHESFDTVGGFDERFFLYKEEEDLAVRLRASGVRTYYDPSIRILHHGSVVANKESQYFGESIEYYNRKHSVS